MQHTYNNNKTSCNTYLIGCPSQISIAGIPAEIIKEISRCVSANPLIPSERLHPSPLSHKWVLCYKPGPFETPIGVLKSW